MRVIGGLQLCSQLLKVSSKNEFTYRETEPAHLCPNCDQIWQTVEGAKNQGAFNFRQVHVSWTYCLVPFIQTENVGFILTKPFWQLWSCIFIVWTLKDKDVKCETKSQDFFSLKWYGPKLYFFQTSTLEKFSMRSSSICWYIWQMKWLAISISTIKLRSVLIIF